jgi:hypothetical protein
MFSKLEGLLANLRGLPDEAQFFFWVAVIFLGMAMLGLMMSINDRRKRGRAPTIWASCRVKAVPKKVRYRRFYRTKYGLAILRYDEQGYRYSELKVWPWMKKRFEIMGVGGGLS